MPRLSLQPGHFLDELHLVSLSYEFKPFNPRQNLKMTHFNLWGFFYFLFHPGMWIYPLKSSRVPS
jgi:hypothetical protein